MKKKSNRLKLLCLMFFIAVAAFSLVESDRIVSSTSAFSAGPPVGVTGAPGEVTCTVCHGEDPGTGAFTITPPQNYTPGQTYQVVVRHVTSDATRLRWGFELTALAGTTMAGSFDNLGGNTQTLSGMGDRLYIEQTTAGTFANQAGGAVWTFNWIAPATNLGPVTFYSAGNQANNNSAPGGDHTFVATAISQPPAAPQNDAPFDFDGDGKTDIGIFRPGPGEWWYQRSSDGQVPATQFGQTTDKIVPGDYTGDGKADIAIWRPSTGFWYVIRSEDNSFFAFPFGQNGDIPVPADYDADGKTDTAVFRPSTATWFIPRSGGGGTSIFQFGITGDQPTVADYDGDGKADVAIFRPGPGEWWIQRSTAGILAFQFGAGTDKPVQGDYTGDGKADAAFWRPSNGFWYIIRSEDFSFYAFPFGQNGDIVAPGDYDGDGKFDTTVFRPAQATWFINRTTAGTLITQFGINGDQPIANAFVP